jgi:glycolate oxidase
MKISAIGGNLAENSGGLHGLKYGITRNYVMASKSSCPTSRPQVETLPLNRRDRGGEDPLRLPAATH